MSTDEEAVQFAHDAARGSRRHLVLALVAASLSLVGGWIFWYRAGERIERWVA